jgi:hypothetical protein
MDGGSGSGKGAALAELSSNDDPAPPTREAPANVAAPLRKFRLSTKLFFVGTGIFSLGINISPIPEFVWSIVIAPIPLFNLRLIFPDSHADSPGRMAGNAGGCGGVQFVATNATAHGSRALDLRHRIHLGNVTMAHLTFHPFVEMFTVRIASPGQ